MTQRQGHSLSTSASASQRHSWQHHVGGHKLNIRRESVCSLHLAGTGMTSLASYQQRQPSQEAMTLQHIPAACHATKWLCNTPSLMLSTNQPTTCCTDAYRLKIAALTGKLHLTGLRSCLGATCKAFDISQRHIRLQSACCCLQWDL